MKKITILTIFPDAFNSFQNDPLIKRASAKQILQIQVVDIRNYADGSFRHIDDSPYGGGSGMLLKCEPIIRALQSHETPHSYRILLSASGTHYTQKHARQLSEKNDIILLCGHYEGIDARVESYFDEQLSLGDYILSGGETAAMVIIDSIVRLQKGIIRNESTMDESFENGLLEYPQYTRPPIFDGKAVPDVLLHGHHEAIKTWRRREALQKTFQKRPELLHHQNLSDEDRAFLQKIQRENMIQLFPIQEMDGILIGNAEYTDSATGCTVFLTAQGCPCGLDVRGGGPASRESALLSPLAANERVDAIVLTGGSAFGLSTADGVMQFLEERKQGFKVGNQVVPIVCASALFDLQMVGNSARPDAKLGYQACQNAGNYKDGCFGAGCGASVGKLLGPTYSMKSGIGSCAFSLGNLQIGAVVAVNAVGNVIDGKGNTLAGIYDHESGFIDAQEALLRMTAMNGISAHAHTTIGVILTNAHFTKSQLNKIAALGHDGMARTIRPIHTTYDGDSLYAMSLGTLEADLNVVGALAADAVSKAIEQAVRSASSAYGLVASADLCS